VAIAPALLLLALLLPSQASAAGCGYGTGGAYASNLCWLDMATYNDTVARSPAGQPMSITLPGGYTATFTLTSRLVPGRNYPVVDALAAPLLRRFAYGSSDYVGVPGGPVLYSRSLSNAGVTLTLSNIRVVDASGAVVTGYSFVIADAENNIAGAAESFTWTSDKSLGLIAVMNPTSTRGCHNALTGLGTTTVTCTGQGTDPPGAGSSTVPLYDGVIVGADTPSTIGLTMRTNARSGVAFAIMTARIRVTKSVAGRVRASDSFDVSARSPEGSVVGSASTGSSDSATTGPLTVLPRSGGAPYTLAEAVTAGSGTRLADYAQSWSCTNNGVAMPSLSGGGTSRAVSPAAGDDITCTVTNTQLPADVSIAKTVSDTTPTIGDTITYKLVVASNGPSSATNVVVDDTAPAGLALLSAMPSQGSCSSASSCQLGTLAAGDTATITVTAKVQAEGTLTNTATVRTSTPDRDASNDSSRQTIDVQPSADLKLVKTASATTVHEGEDFHYTVVVTNAGPSTARAATVTDSLPAGVSLRSAASTRGSCTQGDPVVCQLGDIPSGGSATITLEATATDAGRPENTAVVESPTADPDTTNNSDHTTVTTDRLADLAIAKSASTSVVATGEAFDYTLKVTSKGPSRATGTTVTDTVPRGLRIEAASSSRGTCGVTGQTITCDLGTLSAGASATITMTVLTTKAGAYANSASVTSETPDPHPDDNVDDAATVEVSPRADVSIVKTATSPTALIGDTVTYELTVANHGPDDAADVTVTDPLPADSSFVSAKPSSGTCAVVAGTLVCDVGSVANGSVVRIQLQVILTAAGDTRNVAQVTTSTPDPKPANNQASTAMTTEKADVSLTKSASTDKPSIGRTITYTITARNAGPAVARGVVVTDPLPGSLKYVSAKPSAGSCALAQGAVVCNVGDIAGGRAATVSLRAVVLRVGQAGNAASAVARYPDDPNTANNLVRSVVKAAAPRLTLRKTASRPTVSTGGRVSFALRVYNTGGSTAHHVLVCDDMPSGLVVASTSPHAKLRSGDYCWTISSLAPRRAKTLSIVATALSRTSGRRVNHAVLNARDARPLSATRAVRVDRVRILGGGVTG
jgi:large repetitive protein